MLSPQIRPSEYSHSHSKTNSSEPLWTNNLFSDGLELETVNGPTENTQDHGSVQDFHEDKTIKEQSFNAKNHTKGCSQAQAQIEKDEGHHLSANSQNKQVGNLQSDNKMKEKQKDSSLKMKNIKSEIHKSKRLANKYKKKGQYQVAIKMLEEVKEKAEKEFDANSQQTAQILYTLGIWKTNWGNYKGAMKDFHECCTILQEVKGFDSLAMVCLLNQLGNACLGDRNKAAISHYENAEKICTKLIDKEGTIIHSNILDNLAAAYLDRKMFKEAEETLKKSKQIKIELKMEQSLQMADTLNAFGILYKSISENQQQLQQAKDKYGEALKLLEKLDRKGSLRYAYVIRNIGKVEEKLGNYRAALENYTESNRIQKMHNGESIDFSTTLLDIASALKQLERFKQAEEELEKALQIQKQIQGDDSRQAQKTQKRLNKLRNLIMKEEQQNNGSSNFNKLDKNSLSSLQFPSISDQCDKYVNQPEYCNSSTSNKHPDF